jgi:hypothetical protein
MVEPLARWLALAPVEEDEITDGMAAAISEARVLMARGEWIPARRDLAEVRLSR